MIWIKKIWYENINILKLYELKKNVLIFIKYQNMIRYKNINYQIYLTPYNFFFKKKLYIFRYNFFEFYESTQIFSNFVNI